jgi:capsid protein
MGIAKDVRFVASHFAKAFKYRPSIVAKRNHEAQIKQAGYRRGFAYGAERAKMYFPGAETGILQGDWPTTERSMASVIRDDFAKLCARSESAIRTDAVARRAEQILDTFIVGKGNKPFPCIIDQSTGEPAEELNSKLSDDWERFNDQGTRTSTIDMTMYQAQSLDFKTIFKYGNVLTKTVSSKKGSWLPFAFQTLKPTRLDFSKDNYFDSQYVKQPGPIVLHGIEMANGYPDPVAFYLKNEATKVSAKEMMLSFYQIEAEQYLGLPWLTPVLVQLYNNQDLFKDKMNQSRIGAKLGYKIPKDDADGIDNLLSNTSEGSEYFDLDFQGFYISDGKPEPIAMTDPISETFAKLVEMTIRYVSIGLGLSYGSLSSDLNNSNFSASRQNKLIEDRIFNTLFKVFTKISCQKKYEKFVEWECFSGKLDNFGLTYSRYVSDPWLYNQCYWLPMDSVGWIDPKNAQETLLLAYKMGQITYQKLCSMEGASIKSMISQLTRERKMLTDAGLTHLLPENIALPPAQQTTALQEQEANANA